MEDRTLVRIGAASAVLGAIITVIGNVMYPRVDDVDDVQELATEIAGSDVWIGTHFGLMIGVVLILGGLIALARTITGENGRALARLGLAAALVSTAVFAVLMAIDGPGVKQAADAWADAAASGIDQKSALNVVDVMTTSMAAVFSVWIVIGLGLTYVFFGLAVALSDVYYKWLGWAGALLGVIGAVIGLIQFYEGIDDTLTNVVFPIVATLVLVWVAAMGVLMYRDTLKSSAPA
ncbi:MAG: hypothetical protein V3S18_05815 [Dehalococcoidia bacterium]